MAASTDSTSNVDGRETLRAYLSQLPRARFHPHTGQSKTPRSNKTHRGKKNTERTATLRLPGSQNNHVLLEQPHFTRLGDMRTRTCIHTLIAGLGHEHGLWRLPYLAIQCVRFSKIGHIIFRAVVALKTSVPFTCRFVACSARVKVEQTDRQTDTQTDRPSTVTLAAHARRGLKGG